MIKNYSDTGMLYVLAGIRLDAIKKETEAIEARLNKAPHGSVRFIKCGERIQFYLRTDAKDKSGVYLKKSEIRKTQIYMQKSYDVKVLRILEKEEHILEKLLDKAEDCPHEMRKVYSALPDRVKEMINPVDISDEDFVRKWMEIPFEGKEIEEEKKIYRSNRGEYVRSKSELTIANTLDRMNIPYKYECPLQLKSGVLIYPDFTVLNVRTRKVLYWEHRGMMDSMDYARGAIFRNKEYMKNNIIPGRNLIITEETSADSLSTNEIDIMIREYLM